MSESANAVTSAMYTNVVHTRICPRFVTFVRFAAKIAPRYIKRYRKVVGEDNVAMELQLKGLTSPYASPGRFSDREILVHRIDNWVLDQILGREKKVASSV